MWYNRQVYVLIDRSLVIWRVTALRDVRTQEDQMTVGEDTETAETAATTETTETIETADTTDTTTITTTTKTTRTQNNRNYDRNRNTSNSRGRSYEGSNRNRNSRSSNGNQNEQRTSPKTCFLCGKIGHMRKDCYMKRERSGVQAQVDQF